MKKYFLTLFICNVLYSSINAQSSNHIQRSNLINYSLQGVRSDWIGGLIQSQLLNPEFVKVLYNINQFESENGKEELGQKSVLINCSKLKNESQQICEQGMQLLLNFQFDQAQNILGKYLIKNPDNLLVRYLLGISQLSKGSYGSAASNLSKVNYELYKAGREDLKLWRDDVRFNYAISVTMIPDGKKIAKTLFKQLNYEGGKYQNISVQMEELL